MDSKTRNGVVGLTLIGIGAGLAVIGGVLLAPVCVSWSKNRLQKAYEQARKGLVSGFETATDTLGEVAAKAQYPLGEAAKAARHTTSIAAGAVESAAHYVRQRVS